MIEGFLQQVEVTKAPAAKAIIAPHAGYACSGPVAASAYARLAPARDVIKRVVLLGPSHQVQFDGLATTNVEAWATPLGTVDLDTAATQTIRALPQVRVLDEAHADEHSLEVHLPFLQVVLADFRIVPLLAGEASADQVAEVIETLWDGDETRFVVSSDLSHYHDYPTAQQMDSATTRAIEALRFRDIGEEQACGYVSIRALLRVAGQHGLTVRTLDLRNSGDTGGPWSHVVGYGSFAFG
jgi:AmmeMemoRadiSam system protein B